jgi:L-ascorbate metabolism protein UlaG (beta-lactamase superfamily)
MTSRRPAALLRTLLRTAAAAGVGTLALAARGVPTAMGAPEDVLRATAEGSPRAAGGLFRNTLPGTVVAGGNAGLVRALLTRGSTGRPRRPIPLAPVEVPARAAPLAVTWYGHSSALIEIDGRRLLADPVWSERASPSRWIGPRRLHPVPAPLAGLPAVDAVLVSHDHYDHLDLATVRALASGSAAPFVVPLGIGAHLRGWGVPCGRIVELDWNGTAEVAGLTLTCTEARHFSGRGLTRNTTLWSSWAVTGPAHRVFFGGDTGYTAAFADVGRRLGPFDLVLLPIGAYSHHWPDVHMTPEQTVRAHRDLRGGVLVPVHWATFNLGFHRWSEPVERLREAAEAAGARLALPRPGERVDLAAPLAVHDWWSAVG